MAATADRPPAAMSGCCYHPGGVNPRGSGAAAKHPNFCNCFDNGGIIIKPGVTVFRNDTGRNLGPDEWHLLTFAGEIPPGVDADAFTKRVLLKPGARLYTQAEVREFAAEVTQRLLDEVTGRADVVDEGRAVPASPTTEVVTFDAPAGTITIGFDAAADGETTLVAVDADGKMVQW